MAVVNDGDRSVARFEEAVYVLHAFQKKTQKTTKQDLRIGQQRYQDKAIAIRSSSRPPDAMLARSMIAVDRAD